MQTKPNVVIIMTDQQRADLSAREGFPLDTTPFLDHLAQQGTWFNRAYTAMPTCTPARISMLTGRYPSATRVRTNHNTPDATFSQDLFQVFRENGYQTGLFGKNGSHVKREDLDACYEAGHLRAEDDDTGEDYQAFAAFMQETHFQISLKPTPYPVSVQFPYRIVSRAQDWLLSLADSDKRDDPFFLWLSFPEPHNPYQVPEPYYSLFSPQDLPPPRSDKSALATKGFKYEWCYQSFNRAFPDFDENLPRARSNYLGLLRLIDDQVKRFVTFLEAENLRDNTIIIFLSDHGDFAGEYGLMRKGPELPEALTRIPLSFTGPGIKAGDAPHPGHISITDIMPTLCDMLGVDLPDGVQGRSLWPLLTGQPYPAEEFESAYAEIGFGGLYYTADEPLDPVEDGLVVSPDGETWGAYDCLNSWTQSGQVRMVRKGDWKLIYDMQGQGQLYNLVEDPVELNNRYGQADVAAKQGELMTDLLTWVLRVQDPLPLPRRRYVMKKDPRNYWTAGEKTDKRD